MSTLATTRKDDLSKPAGTEHAEEALHVVLEGERVLAGGLRARLDGLEEVRIGRGTERTWELNGRGGATLTIPDPRMSGRHARLARSPEGWRFEDLGSTNGSFVDGRRATQATLEAETVLTLGATCLLFDPAQPTTSGFPALVDAPSLRSRPRGTATLTPSVERELPRLLRVSMSKLSVLLLGESGVGKEVLAQAVHRLSNRAGPFVAINCGALTPSLIESQLFGHTKGAFSGALRDEPGLVRASSGGTLFLDEIGELSAAAQGTLLRVLQEREVLPVGATKPVPVDLRVVAATLKPIDESPTFRTDLYARVAAFVHRLAPLRERRADLGLLVADLLPRLAPERAATLRLAPDLVTALVTHAWPHNVRELLHALSVALVTSTGELLRLEDVGEALRVGPESQLPRASALPSTRSRVSAPRELAADSADDASPSLAGAPSEPEAARPLTERDAELRRDLESALARTQGNVSEVARSMGKTRMQIHRWMKRFGMSPESFRGA